MSGQQLIDSADTICVGYKPKFWFWKEDKNNFSYWFPKIEKCGIPVPPSQVFQLPDNVITALFLEHKEDRQILTDWLNKEVLPSVPVSWTKLFIKNGTFSNKFSFGECCGTTITNVEELLKAFINITQDSLLFGTEGNSELVVREYIDDNVVRPTIYYGMPLRPEIRVFYDFDNKKVCYSVNYWDWDYCHEAISNYRKTDGEIYEHAYPALNKFVQEEKDNVEFMVNDAMQVVEGLQGVWSIDLMYANKQWWLIDMAEGSKSAYYDPDKIK